MSLMAKLPTPQDGPVEIYLPDFHFPDSSTSVAVTDGKWSIGHEDINSVKIKVLKWWHGRGGQEIRVQGLKRKPEEYTNPHCSEDMTYLEQCLKGGCNIM